MGVFSDIKATELKTEELTKLVSKVQAIAGDGYEVTSKNYEIFMKPMKKILRLSKQDKEWYLYFDTIYEILYLSCEHNKFDEVVKYAELYYRESALYMDMEIPNYPNKNMAYLNTWIYGYIFKAYYHYHQINDEKMDVFMEKYEGNALKYGKTYKYYADVIKLSVLYRDVDGSKAAARHFRRYEKDMFSCYVCGHKPYLSHLLLADEIRQAEEMMLNFINQNIPQQHLWCYKYCLDAGAIAMYRYVLHVCIECGNEEAFRHFYTKYWQKLPYESQWESDAYTFRRLLCALSGVFRKLKDDIREAEKNIKEENHFATVDNIELALDWWCYFTLLDRSGIHEVEIKLPALNTPDAKTKEDAQTADVEESGKGAEDAGKVSTLSVAEYMEKRADEFGALFSKARARFDYEGLKGTYRNCFLAEKN
ncbi:MAG: hypothetical protein J1E03_12875 [Acetatifactor sp.]|nr:hypothetical protein [Acetatifactor sp.]